MISVFRPGQFVWCRFPTAERPKLPAKKIRIGYVQDVQRVGRNVFVAALYTTTTPWRPDTPRPLGIIPIEGGQAARLGQRPFVVDARCIALLSVDIEFFPFLVEADHGVQGEASPGLSNKITAVLTEMRRRQITIDLRGPGRRT